MGLYCLTDILYFVIILAFTMLNFDKNAHQNWFLQTQATITTLPKSGSLYQVSFIYNKYGYDLKIYTLLTTVPTNVAGDDRRVVYVRPNINQELKDSQWD